MKKILLGLIVFILVIVYFFMKSENMQEDNISLDLSSLAQEEPKDESKVMPSNDEDENEQIKFESTNTYITTEQVEKPISVEEDSQSDYVDIVEIPEIPNPLPLEADLKWQVLDNGLDYINKKEKFFLEKLILDIDVHILRINTEEYDIDLYGTFIDNSEAKSVRDWALEKELLIAMNASMYLPDNKTSNGYMRSYEHINNGQIMEKMSGFFFTQPKDDALAQSIIVENTKSTDNIKVNDFVDMYEVAIQNFRILGNYREDIQESVLLWEQNREQTSIAAYGDDVDGNIYFVFSRAPLSVYEFGNYMLSLANEGLHLKSLLYAEGGSEAGLFLKTPENQYFIAGIVRNTPFSNIGMAVPNVLGIKKRVK